MGLAWEINLVQALNPACPYLHCIWTVIYSGSACEFSLADDGAWYILMFLQKVQWCSASIGIHRNLHGHGQECQCIHEGTDLLKQKYSWFQQCHLIQASCTGRGSAALPGTVSQVSHPNCRAHNINMSEMHIVLQSVYIAALTSTFQKSPYIFLIISFLSLFQVVRMRSIGTFPDAL